MLPVRSMTRMPSAVASSVARSSRPTSPCCVVMSQIAPMNRVPSIGSACAAQILVASLLTRRNSKENAWRWPRALRNSSRTRSRSSGWMWARIPEGELVSSTRPSIAPTLGETRTTPCFASHSKPPCSNGSDSSIACPSSRRTSPRSSPRSAHTSASLSFLGEPVDEDAGAEKHRPRLFVLSNELGDRPRRVDRRAHAVGWCSQRAERTRTYPTVVSTVTRVAPARARRARRRARVTAASPRAGRRTRR